MVHNRSFDLSSIDAQIEQIADQFEAPRQLIDVARVDKMVEKTQEQRLSGNFAGILTRKSTKNNIVLRDFSICFLRQRDGTENELHIQVKNGWLILQPLDNTDVSVLEVNLQQTQFVKTGGKTPWSESSYGLELISLIFNPRCIHFRNEQAQHYWHEKIIQEQGFDDTCESQYQLFKVLGEGGFSKVYHARHRLSLAQYAVKVVGKARIAKVFLKNGHSFIEPWLIQMLARERNPQLLRAIERFEDEKNYYYISELKSGGELIACLTGDKLRLQGEALGKRVIMQVGEGLRVLHQRNIIHRDVKLQNILVSDQHSNAPSFTLADFGSAVQLMSADDTNRFEIGTKGYFAPEMLLSRGYNCAIDIFALGVVLYAILTKTLPFDHSDTEKYENQVIENQVNFRNRPLAANLSAEVKDLVEGMLKKDPTERLTIEQVLAHQWFK